MQRRQDFLDGKTKGMPGISLGVAVRMIQQGLDWKEPLLPTPRVSSANGPTRKEIEAGNPKSRLEVEVVLLPTPTVSDSKGATRREVAEGNPKHRLRAEVELMPMNWGKYAPAIERWEKLHEPAPLPTEPTGPDGEPRLSARFTEWMMGLPAGFICDSGISRTKQLKACGNGVVPQQAALALTLLLDGVEL